jgi:hypothetical protein
MLTWPCRAKFKEREYYSIDLVFSSSIFTIFALREKHQTTPVLRRREPTTEQNQPTTNPVIFQAFI